jgi:hypothetical protein
MTTLTLTKIRQRFERPRLSDIPEAVRDALADMASHVAPGASIAIAVGSRGIANLATIVRTTVAFVEAHGGHPFIIPAMGSHGGGTAVGQAEVLASYGVTPEAMGCPVRSSMETVELTGADSPARVFMDHFAYESDGVILINRVKLHTDFHGRHESGLVKLSVIGLGKHRQALEIHSHGVYGLRNLIPPTAARIFDSGKVLFGMALVENAYDETMKIQALEAGEIMEKEPALLALSRANMPSLPVDDVDLLLIDEMGKDISGAGIDPNIIGRNMIRGEPEPERPRIKAIVVTDLTPASHGNAVGIGLADVVTKQLVDKIDLDATYENTVTSTFLERGKIPVTAPDAREAYAWARRSCGVIPEEDVRVIRIRNTLELSEVYVSDAVLADLSDREDVVALQDATPVFDDTGAMTPF